MSTVLICCAAHRGPILEVIVSRMRYIAAVLNQAIRFVGLSTALANAADLADWLGISPKVRCYSADGQKHAKVLKACAGWQSSSTLPRRCKYYSVASMHGTCADATSWGLVVEWHLDAYHAWLLQQVGAQARQQSTLLPGRSSSCGLCLKRSLNHPPRRACSTSGRACAPCRWSATSRASRASSTARAWPP